MERCQVVHLAMTDGETPYVVPLSFGWSAEGGRLTLYSTLPRRAASWNFCGEIPGCASRWTALFR
ncbi:MAG: hypothetical protein LUG44_01485 [Clostridiales bacterium]|nr:hypothetical protein [Clostridiales bacterium]